MAVTLRATKRGLEMVERSMRSRGWGRQSVAWYDQANVSLATLKRFWQRKPISESAFQAICQAVQVDWRLVAHTEKHAAAEDMAAPDAVWVGRMPLLQELRYRWQQGCRLLVVTGMTGIGKTVLVQQFCDRLQSDYPVRRWVNLDSHEHTNFSHIAPYLPGVILGDPVTDASALERMKVIATHLIHQPNLVVLDGLEAALSGDEAHGWSCFKDELWGNFFHRILSAATCQSLILVTSQQFPMELRETGSRYPNHWHEVSLKGLSADEQSLLFQGLGLEDLAEPALEKLRRIGAAYEGHPLALQIIAGEILSTPFDGDVLAYWNTYGSEIEAVEQALQATSPNGERDVLRLDSYTRHLRHIVRRRIEMSFDRLQKEVPIAYWLLCLGAVYRRPVVVNFWLKMLDPLQLDLEYQWRMLDALRDRYLVEETLIQQKLHLRQHPLIRSLALSRLRQMGGSGQVPPPRPSETVPLPPDH